MFILLGGGIINAGGVSVGETVLSPFGKVILIMNEHHVANHELVACKIEDAVNKTAEFNAVFDLASEPGGVIRILGPIQHLDWNQSLFELWVQFSNEYVEFEVVVNCDLEDTYRYPEICGWACNFTLGIQERFGDSFLLTDAEGRKGFHAALVELGMTDLPKF